MQKQTVYFLMFTLLLWGCKQSYEPPAIQQPNRFLVVEGVINAAPDSKTEIRLSRTRNLADSVVFNPEAAASVQIEAQGGTIIPLQEQNGSLYTADHLTLDPATQYRLRIHTRDGSQYLSDFVPVKQTPPIDSVTWKQEGDVTIYVNTHDPANQAKYYRWDFDETWQYHAFLESFFGLGVQNGRIFFRDATNQTYNCWITKPSTEILLSSSLRLNEDVIAQFPINVIPKNTERLDIRYSILVRQYALTEQAYNYWEILRKNSQTLGTLFDAQPGQLIGNIRNVANAAEPVIGYVSASTVQQQRIFIDNADLTAWKSPVPNFFCSEQTIGLNPVDPFIWDYPDTAFEPWFFASGGGLRIARRECLDCRLRGGVNQKPTFW